MKSLLFAGFALAAIGAGLSGCVESQVHLSDGFGAAVRQDMVSQVADPDRVYGPPPPSNGARVVLGQQRYRTGTTIPAQATASEIGSSAGAPPPVAAPSAPAAPAGS